MWMSLTRTWADHNAVRHEQKVHINTDHIRYISKGNHGARITWGQPALMAMDVTESFDQVTAHIRTHS